MTGNQNTTASRNGRKEARTRHGAGASLAALNDPRPLKSCSHADGKLWLERLGEPMKSSARCASRAQTIIETIAGYHGKVTRSSRSWKAELPLMAVLRRPAPAGCARTHLRHSEEAVAIIARSVRRTRNR